MIQKLTAESEWESCDILFNFEEYELTTKAPTDQMIGQSIESFDDNQDYVFDENRYIRIKGEKTTGKISKAKEMTIFKVKGKIIFEKTLFTFFEQLINLDLGEDFTDRFYKIPNDTLIPKLY